MSNSKLIIALFCLFAISVAQSSTCTTELAACTETACKDWLATLSACTGTGTKLLLCTYNYWVTGSSSSNTAAKNYSLCMIKLTTDPAVAMYAAYEPV